MNHRNAVPQVAGLINVSKSFGANGAESRAVKNVSLQLYASEMTLLLGPSGSGKTTLLTLLAGLLRPSSGAAFLFGRDVESYSPEELQNVRARRLGFIFQNFHLIDFLTVEENVELVMHFAGTDRGDHRARTRSLLTEMNIGHLALRFPLTLSQGEKQRVAIARAIANDADLIIADEPTASLETRQGLEVIRQLHLLATANGKCVVVASHDLRLKDYADRVLQLVDGKLEETMQQAEPAGTRTRADASL